MDRMTLAVLAVCAGVGVASAQQVQPLEVASSQNTQALRPCDVFEITFTHDGQYADPFADVDIQVELTAPSGQTLRIGGFHYGSTEPPGIRILERGPGGRPRRVAYEFDRADTWKARFAPNELGQWTYAWLFRNRAGGQARGSGRFACVPGRVQNHGFVRRNPANSFLWVFDDGSPYFPIGLQDCWGDGSGCGSVVAGAALEGPFRTDRTNLVELPDGPLYVRGPGMNPQNGDVYFRRHGRCGFNLFRFSPENCSYPLNRNLDRYLVQEAIMTDELLRTARKYDFRIMYGIFGYQKVFNENPGNAEGMARIERFVKYSVDRWGAYVDIWEFLNEQNAPDAWYARMVPYLRSIDPYGHPITTSWERPQLDGIEINAPHWYQRESELDSDRVTAQRAGNWKKHRKPVIVGEQGNWVDNKKPRPVGVGGVWDAGSARRMRIRNWTALFTEIAVVFWDTSYARDGHFMNIWLGPTEREYVRAMQDFAYRLDSEVRMVPVEVSSPQEVRAYGLASRRRAAAYLHHFGNHERPVRGLVVALDVPAAATAYWYSPADAAVLGALNVPAGPQRLEAPPFVVDMALLITPDGPPDIDGDGVPNHLDPDDDDDGVEDAADAFPLEPEEWADVDRDLIGDNLDADLDADGMGDDRNGNGTPDHEEMDLDGDGFPRAQAVPWDAFPLDPTEWRDTDGDAIGDNGDPDDDGDGWSDAEEQAAGTDPLDAASFPVG
jgi:hypothetical protein